MSAVSIVGGFIGARAKHKGKAAFTVTALFTGVRVFRRLIRSSTKPAARFVVKPGEVYEIKGLRRGR